MNQISRDQAMRIALQHHQCGRLADAERIYQQVLGQWPNDSDALNLLGVIARQVGQPDIAFDLARRAVISNPKHADAHMNLGTLFAAQGGLDDAIASYLVAIQLNPHSAEALRNIAVAYKTQGKYVEAGAALFEAIALRPDLAELHSYLGDTLCAQWALDEAAASYGRALQLKPDSLDAHIGLGNVWHYQGKYEDSVIAYLKSIQLKPDYAEAHYNLGAPYRSQGKLDQAIDAYRRAVNLKPDLAAAHYNLGCALQELGRHDEALASIDQAMAFRPREAVWHSGRLYTLLFHPEHNASTIDNEHRVWNERHALPLKKFIVPHTNDPNPDRRLRIGYFSPDFRDHVVGRNLLPLFREHARDQFEVFCYSNVLRPDDVTTQFRSHCDGWRSIIGLSDERAAELVREDRIDILVDLTLHMAGKRLLVFARKPAPVQVTFAGYPGSTGLDAIDYRLTDSQLDPPGQGDEFYSEQSVRLPDSFWCYDPAAMTRGIEPQPAPLQALFTGAVTFGCLNNFCKVNDHVLALWARVLMAVAGSRLMLMAPLGSARNRTLQVLGREGIDSARIEFVAKAQTDQYFRRYGQIDIGLDTFPYNGHTTSLDALWMGVPVVTLLGKTVVGRAGFSQLTNLNLTELVATNEDQYVRIATDLARDLPRLSELRAGLRQRMRASALTDAPRFARNVEAAYRDMWRRWCQTAVEPASH